MRALDEDDASDNQFALEQIHQFLARESFRDDPVYSELAECVATDEEYLRINTELRLMRDGIKGNFNSSPQLEMEQQDEHLI